MIKYICTMLLQPYAVTSGVWLFLFGASLELFQSLLRHPRRIYDHHIQG